MRPSFRRHAGSLDTAYGSDDIRYRRKTFTKADTVIRPTTIGIAGMINRGCAATTINAITPITGALAGNHFAGRLSDGQASHSAPITRPILPQAAAAKVPELVVVNNHASSAPISIMIENTNAIIRRRSRAGLPSTGDSVRDIGLRLRCGQKVTPE